MIKRGDIFFFAAISGAAWVFCNNVFAAQTAKAELPITMTVTNPQCSINAGKGLPDTVQLPIVTTAGVSPDGRSAEVPIIISCAGNVSKFEITLTGGKASRITTTNSMVDIVLSWKKGGAAVQFGTPVTLNKIPFMVSNKEFDASLVATVTPQKGTIPAGIYTASLPVTLTFY